MRANGVIVRLMKDDERLAEFRFFPDVNFIEPTNMRIDPEGYFLGLSADDFRP